MKLRNRKTGEIIEVLEKPSFVKRNDDYLQSEVITFNSLAELNADWEDAPEEPKEYWYIISTGEVCSISEDEEDEEDTKVCKEIGNYFETRKEAELAVRKLKAWKRLNNCGLKFIDWWLSKDNHIIIGTNRQIFDIDEQGLREDLDLLFGGGE